jgi:hypothetical protein
MNYQNETLPEGARKVGSTPSMTETEETSGQISRADHHCLSILMC